MSKIKLKPCPFCGGEAFCYVSGRIEPEMPDMFWVRCKNCDVVTKSYTTREKAIKKWNTRALGWIPVEERLPEKFSIGVEVTTKDLERNLARYAKPPMDMWISVYTGRTLDVIAWKEPSESYHPEGLEKARKE